LNPDEIKPRGGRYRIEAIRGEGGRLDVTDYRCQECHKLVHYQLWGGQYCPHCGAPIFSAPRRKLAGPTGRRPDYGYLEKLEYAGPQPKSHDPDRRKKRK
jgi:DNA-directed RNA polymerase subunit RPC12/RpoP